MKKVTFKDVPKIARNESLFTDTVYAQSILEHEDSDNFNFAIVNFPESARTKFHNSASNFSGISRFSSISSIEFSISIIVLESIMDNFVYLNI